MPASPNATATARARARAEITAAVLDAARGQLAEVGAAGLSLRGVARELGMTSSAVYRYVASRDELLTRLIVEAFDAMGLYAERAAARARKEGAEPGAQWLAICRAMRQWALTHPHEHALVFGSPVPGYRAPQDTVGPAIRIPHLLAGVLRAAAESGALLLPARPLPGPSLASVSTVEVGGVPPAPYDDLLERALVLWTSLIGSVSAELFGHVAGAVTDEAAFFDRAVAVTAAVAGLTVPVR